MSQYKPKTTSAKIIISTTTPLNRNRSFLETSGSIRISLQIKLRPLVDDAEKNHALSTRRFLMRMDNRKIMRGGWRYIALIHHRKRLVSEQQRNASVSAMENEITQQLLFIHNTYLFNPNYTAYRIKW